MKERLIKILEKNFYTVRGLGAGIILIMLIITTAFDNFIEKGIPNFLARCFIYAVVLVIWVIIWNYSRSNLPHNPKGKVGLLLAINTENDKQKVRIKNDLVEGINKLLKQYNLYKTVNVIVIEDFKANKVVDILYKYMSKKDEIYHNFIDLDDNIKWRKVVRSKEHKSFIRLYKRVNCHFYAWGKIKERSDKENKYYISLRAFVVHKYLRTKLTETIKKEFVSIFPREISFPEKMEVKGFELTSDLLFIAAMYITGFAALLSGDPFTAFKLHNGIQNEMNKFHPMPPNLQHIIKNLEGLRLFELLEQARFYYSVKQDFIMTKKLLSEAESINDKNYDTLVFISLYAFEVEKDISKALEYLKKAEELSSADYTWLYNRAFIFMYTGNYKKGLNDYKKLTKIKFLNESSVVNQCIKFNENLIKVEPDKYQSLFIVGYLYCFKKNNLKNALNYFELFKEKACINPDFSYLCTRTSTYINQIKNKTNSN